jgi:hypothetical protein
MALNINNLSKDGHNVVIIEDYKAELPPRANLTSGHRDINTGISNMINCTQFVTFYKGNMLMF